MAVLGRAFFRQRKDPSCKGRRGDGFFSGVCILSLSAMIVKIVGLVYKIPMLRLLGSEGMGYFNSAYELYTLLCVIATAGLPVAMAVMIAGAESNGGRVERIFRVSRLTFLVLGVIGTAILLGFAKPLATFLGSDRALYCIYAIAPTVFFICMAGAYRGYFQGLGNMTPTALSQVIEALGKLILGLIFASLALRAGLPTEAVAAFAVLGLTLGALVSLFCLLVMKKAARAKLPPLLNEAEEGAILPKLLKLAIPVTLSSGVVSLTRVIDMTMILRRLQSLGQSSSEAFASYGNYTTLALPLFGLAPALIGSVALPLIPRLSRAIASADSKEETNSVADALRLTSLVAMPASVGLVLFAEPILDLLFYGEDEAIAMTAPLLSILGASVVLSCLITVTNAILQAYSSAGLPILSMALGSILKIVMAYFLIGVPQVGILGAPISTFFCDLLICIMNFGFISRRMRELPSLSSVFIRPFVAALLSVSLARFLYNVAVDQISIDLRLLTLLSIALAAMLYLVLSLLLGVAKRHASP